MVSRSGAVRILRGSIVASLLALGCGPAVGSPSESEGGGGSSGEASDSDASASGAGSGGATTTGAATTGGSGGGSPGNPTDTDSVVPCELPDHQSGSAMTISVANGFDVPIVLAGDGCDQPLRLRTLEQERINWDPDCSWPVCPEEIGGWACAVCDCGQITILLEPGESTEFAWSGENYDLIETDPVCGQCNSCWLAGVVPDGIYEVGIPYYEYCAADDECEPAAMQEFVAQLQYPADVVDIVVGP